MTLSRSTEGRPEPHIDPNTTASVEIYDQIYRLRGVDPEHISRLGAMVDSKMRAVSAHGATVDSLRVAVLAALNIADELLELRERHRELVASLDRSEMRTRSRASALSSMLDEAWTDGALERIAV